MTDAPETEAPNGPAEGRETEDLVNSIWQAGWKAGNKYGWNQGYRQGNSAVNQWWAVFAIVVSFGMGIWAGYAFDWVQTCQPIAVGETKSCTTRTGE